MSKKIVTLGTDLGAYLRAYDGAVIMNWPDLMTNAGIDFFVVKSGEENVPAGYSTLKNIKAARDNSLAMVGTYPWFFPAENPKYAVDRWLRSYEKERPDFLYIDAEQITDPEGKIVEGQRISDNLQHCFEDLSSAIPELVVDLYMNTNFLQSSAPQIQKWIYKSKHPWKAGWPDWGLPSYELDWAEFRSGKMKECLDWQALEPRPWRWINLLDGSYEPDFHLWPGLENNLWMWQFSSRILPKAYQPGSMYRHQYDWIMFNGDLETMKKVMKKQSLPVEKSMATIYDPSVPMSARAPMIELSSDYKTVDVPAIAKAGTSAVIVRVAGEDGTPVPSMYGDAKAGEYLEAAASSGIAGIAEVNLRAGYYLDNQKNMGGDPNSPVKGILDEAVEDNPIIRAMIGVLRKKFWTFPTLSATDGGWFPFNGLMFNIWDMTTKNGGDPGGAWQAATLQHAIWPINDLMNKGKFPKVPIWVLTNADFIKHYEPTVKTDVNRVYTWLYNNKNLIKLGLSDLAFTAVPAAIPMTSLKEVWDTYRPTDKFQFKFVPFGWEFHWPLQGTDTPIWFHYYTYDRFPVPEIKDVLGKPVTVRAFLFSGNQATLYDHLKFVPNPVTPTDPPTPPVPPDPDQPPVENKPTTLPEAIEAIIRLQAHEDEIEDWVRKFPFRKIG